MNKPLVIILLTVLFDIIGLWIVIPILNFVVIDDFWYSEAYVWYTFAIFSLWMFLWWLFFWKLSDKIWRNRVLELTIFLNIVWYILFALSSNLLLFMIARFIWWLWASWFAVWQAYISDISDSTSRTKNMALIWAMFWVWFMIWPVFWWILSWMSEWLNYIWFISAFVAFINLFIVIFMLPKVKQRVIPPNIDKNLKITNPIVLVLLATTFIVALWFSAMQSTFWMILDERFSLNSQSVWYMFWFIGLTALIYQWFIIRYVKKYLNEAYMIMMGLLFLIVSFLLFSINYIFLAIFFIIFMFPIWYGTINPSVASMQAKLWWNHVWKLLWINASMLSLWNIIWPFIAWYSYLIWSWMPYIVSSILFFIAFIFIFFKVKNKYK